MSEMPVSTATLVIYAVSQHTPPRTWSSEWTLFDGDRIAGGDIPTGFAECTEATYTSALIAQEAAMIQSIAAQEWVQRMYYSDQRKALVASGMTVDQARILVPDPNDDYTIDDF